MIPDTESHSSFYPPRARWYGGVLSAAWRLKRLTHLDRFHPPNQLTVRQLLLGILLPGFAFFTNGRRALGWSFVAAYCVGAVVFVIALGYQIGSVAFGVMIGAHATSIIFLEGHWLRERSRFGTRLLVAGLTVLVVWLGIYSPFVGFAQNRLVLPLRVRGKVVVVRRMASPQRVRLGDVVAYSYDEQDAGDAHRGGAVWIRAGYGCGIVLGMGGSEVEFSTNSFSVNGVARKLLPHMATAGNLVVPENCWFIWPEFDITTHGNIGEATISAAMMQLTLVPKERFAGTPFKRWFLRKQILR